MSDHNPIPERYRLPNLIGRLFHHNTQPPQATQPPQEDQGSGFGRYSLPSLVGRLFHHDSNNASPYGGSFFDGGAGQSGGYGNGWGDSGFGSSAMGGFGGQYGGNMPGLGTSGYGSGNLFGSNPNNVDPFGQPTDPTQVGPFGNTQSAPGGGGNGGNNGSGANGAQLAPGMSSWRTGGALAGWGSTRGPNYS